VEDPSALKAKRAIVSCRGPTASALSRAFGILDKIYDRPASVRDMLVRQLNELVNTNCKYDDDKFVEVVQGVREIYKRLLVSVAPGALNAIDGAKGAWFKNMPSSLGTHYSQLSYRQDPKCTFANALQDAEDRAGWWESERKSEGSTVSSSVSQPPSKRGPTAPKTVLCGSGTLPRRRSRFSFSVSGRSQPVRVCA
jgi:hypothetical protein